MDEHVKQLRDRFRLIADSRSECGDWDEEMCHRAEKDMWKLALECISAGTDDPALIAKEALRTTELNFERWYA